MVAVTGTTIQTVLYTRTAEVKKKELTFEQVGVSQNDTITIGEWTTLGGAALVNKATGAAVTCTIATNVITVTGAVSAITVRGTVLQAA